MEALDAVRSLYHYVKTLLPGADTRLLLTSSIEEEVALLKTNVVCVSIGDDTPRFPYSRLGEKRQVRVVIHVINSDAADAFTLMSTLTRSMSKYLSATYYDYSEDPDGVEIPSNRVSWDGMQIQFSHVEHEFKVAYWMCEFDLYYNL